MHVELVREETPSAADSVGPESGPSRGEGSEDVVIRRLIRRLRVSEPPDRFHQLAVNVLRSSLQVRAVAWVPNEPGDAVVLAGSVDRLEPSDYRSLVAAVDLNAPLGRDVCGGRQPRCIPGTVRRFARVSSGSAGVLVAVNPAGDREFEPAEIERLHYVASLIETQLANARVYAELKGLLFGIIQALTAAIDAKDPYTSGHSERVARIAVRIAQELDLPSSRCYDLYVAGLLHDVGKIGVDDEVLNKPGPLSADEFRKIQAHVEIGVNILRDLKKLNHILPSVRHHHESYDGTGYPDRLSGEAIPIEARILAVADSFDAMTSDRPYRKRMSLMKIDEIFRDGRGRQWDPAVVDALTACRSDVEAIRQKGLGESLIGAVDVALGRS